MTETQTMLKKSKIGMWSIDLKDKPCLYVDDNMIEMLGLEDRLSPEETYEYWYERIDKNYVSYVHSTIKDIIDGSISEIEYPWNHPILGQRYVRCGGYVNHKDDSYITLEGYHQDIDEYVRRKSSLESRFVLYDQLLYFHYSSYYMDIYDEMGIIDIETEMMKWIFRTKNKYIDIDEGKVLDVAKNYIHPEELGLITKTYEKVSLKVGLKEHIELRVKRNNGQYSWVRMMMTCVESNSKAKVLTGVVDIDRIKKNEETSKDIELILDVIAKENLYIYDIDFNKNIVRILKDNRDDIRVISIDHFINSTFKASEYFTESEQIRDFLDLNNLKEAIKLNSSKHIDVQFVKDKIVVGWYRLAYSTSDNLDNRILISVKKIERDDILSSVIYRYMVKNFETIFYVDLKEDNYRRFLIDGNLNIRIDEYNSYSEGVDYFLGKYVIDKDKEKIKEKLDIRRIWDIFDQDNFYYTTLGINDENGEFHEKGLYFYVFDEEKQIFLALVNDITKAYYQKIEQENILRDLRKNATIDELTGLSNRYHCESSMIDYLIHEGHNQLSALLLLDLDNFKTLNDTLGHRMGDQALKDVANILNNFFRSTDIISRYGGDEFVVLMKNIRDVGVVDILLPRLLERLKLTYSEDDIEVTIGASIGVSFIPYDGRDMIELFDKADQALYEVKKKEKGKYKVYNF